jgi:hypothetical protein
VVGEDAGVSEGDVSVGEGATAAGEEDVRVGEDATTDGQGGSVCGGRAEGGEECGRQLTAPQSTVRGARRSWIHGEGRGEERSSGYERVDGL